jgi:hypothetical protein
MCIKPPNYISLENIKNARRDIFKANVNSNSYLRHLGMRLCTLAGEFRSLRGKDAPLFSYGINTCTWWWRQTFLSSVDITLNGVIIQHTLLTHCLVQLQIYVTNDMANSFQAYENFMVRSELSRGLRRRSAAARWLGLRFLIPPGHGSLLLMLCVVLVEGFCNGPIPHPVVSCLVCVNEYVKVQQ